MSTRLEVMRLLADGEFHSGSDIGRRLGISRAAVYKGVQTLAALGLDIHRVPGRGYKLAAPVRPLEAGAIRAELARRSAPVGKLEILERVDSTNRYLSAQASSLPAGAVCLAEAQSAGRGRRGRGWLATPYQNLLLSIAWRRDAGPGFAAALGLAAGLAVIEALEEYGASGLGLKWPNDVLWQDRKLAGLLAEVQGEAAGPSLVVLGVGINCRIGEAEARAIDQPWADLETVLGDCVDRNRLAALVVAHLLETCRRFALEGFAPRRAAWERRHLYHGRRVRLLAGRDAISGIVTGVEPSGALRVRIEEEGERSFHSGEISLRADDR